jgi:Ca2+-dependent lipid-binding protein
VNICLSPTNKTQYSTRVISGTLEPVFEETTVLLVDANAAKIGEKVSFQLWDSDRFTADDMIGHVDVDVAGICHITHSRYYSLTGSHL